jgi:hypothetical protein
LKESRISDFLLGFLILALLLMGILILAFTGPQPATDLDLQLDEYH